MPDTPIDLSEGIQSVRLKVPTAEVPIPPEGFAQLHSPAPGELALRLPDGSVVVVGSGGGGGIPAVIAGTGGSIEALRNSITGVGIAIGPATDLSIQLHGPVVGPDLLPFGVQVASVPISSAELLALHTTPKVLVAAPGAGRLPSLIGLRLDYHVGTTVYTTAGDGFLYVKFGTTGATAAQINFANLTGDPDAVAAGTSHAFFHADNWAVYAAAQNQPLLLTTNAAWVDGDGTLTITPIYFV